ncbi:MAG TPA: NADH-quinone oxidoreductase subunit C, partial [Myxococcales bacterium]|nr:NADH-quinone oxidoreductase subunit C [Myxococcales bacterium]
VYDFFGIKFNNHPNLKRLFLPPDWQGYPLRKDYVEPETYRGMPAAASKPVQVYRVQKGGVRQYSLHVVE